MMTKVIKIIASDPDNLPKYQTEGSAGMDLHAKLDEPIILKPMQRKIVPSGISIELPQGLEAQIRPRSGLALKHGVTVLNTPATIDSDYRGEIMVLLVNLGQEDFTIKPGERIAQMVVAAYEHVEWKVVEELGESERSKDGFGSTGK